MAMSGSMNYNEWQQVVQRMKASGTISDNEWQRMTTNDNDWELMFISANFYFFPNKRGVYH